MTDGIELSGADNQAGGGVLDSLQPLQTVGRQWRRIVHVGESGG